MTQDTLKLLTIGNSYSDDMMQHVYHIAADLGVKQIVLGNLFIGGCPIDRHADNALHNTPDYEYRFNNNGTWQTTVAFRLEDAIRAEKWDIISMQQASAGSGIPETYARVPELAAFVRQTAGDHPTFIWHMTWAYPQNSENDAFARYDKDQATMYRKITEAVNECILPSGLFSTVIPCGTAIQNARTSFVGDTLNRDSVHLSLGLGRYIAGLTLVHALTGRDLSTLTYRPEGVSEKEMLVAIEAAQHAVACPFAVTPSKFIT
ncbi:MAG: DUF4886 domain-containing protein [Ruminococcaceae bacterium]|nr:DUF4886 domain-containing protein [Oscillospiraceae bacterium]